MNIPWYHKPANLKYAEEITTEFREALPLLYPEFDLGTARAFFKAGVNNQLVKQLMPTLSAILKEEGLFDTWTSTSFVSAHPEMPINPHIDAPPSATFAGRTFALNWPVYDCDQSRTSFFKMPEGFDLAKHEVLSVNNNGSRYVTLKEVDLELVDSFVLSEPTWLRVDVPHDVQVFGSSTRLSATLRFTPEPFEYHGIEKHSFQV